MLSNPQRCCEIHNDVAKESGNMELALTKLAFMEFTSHKPSLLERNVAETLQQEGKCQTLSKNKAEAD